MGKERDGGHTAGAREGQQWVRARVPAAGKVLEGDDQPTLLHEDVHYLHYITIIRSSNSRTLLNNPSNDSTTGLSAVAQPRLTGCMLMSHPTSFAGSLQRSKPNLASISSFSIARCNLFSVESSLLQIQHCNNLYQINPSIQSKIAGHLTPLTGSIFNWLGQYKGGQYGKSPGNHCQYSLCRPTDRRPG